MIGSLRGVLASSSPSGEITIDVGGVGYRVQVGPALLSRSAVLGEQVFVYVYTHVREEAIVLFGFAEADERACFEVLLASHGVGPSLALAILSVHAPDSLRRVVFEEDLDALTLVPGVGRKTAAKLLIDLKAKLDPLESAAGFGGLQPASGGVLAEVREALSGLGYSPDEARVVLRSLPKEGSVEELLRIALGQLARSK
ncbi:MAG: Holliday junction branch migration protein RuvA [Acidimicrobiales bacterium]